jgi:titin
MSATATSSSSVSLSWNASARASTYEWYWNLSGNTPTTQGADVSGLTGTSDTHGSRTSGTTYYYWVRARNSVGVSGWSNRASATTFVGIPAVPTGVSSTYNGTIFGVYQWSSSWNSVAGATTYDYQWQFGTTSTGGSTNTVNGSTSNTSTSTTNSTKPYARFRVRARNSAGSSSYSSYTAWS